VSALRADITKFHQLSKGSIEAVGLLFSESKLQKSHTHNDGTRISSASLQTLDREITACLRHMHHAWERTKHIHVLDCGCLIAIPLAVHLPCF
jgi:hypothetical protein